jgi:hypothetical protein
MTAALQDNKLTVFHIVYYAVEIVNPARPPRVQQKMLYHKLAHDIAGMLQILFVYCCLSH